MCGSSADSEVIRASALEALALWSPYAERYWWDSPDRPGMGCFGTGYDSWGVQTNQKYVGACAVLATEPGAASDELLDRALRALRYSLATHKSGDCRRTDGTQWGRTWISGLGIERMMHGVEALDEHLTDDDRDGLRRVLTSEADAQLQAEVQAHRWQSTHMNKPESNLWNGAILARAAMMYPDHPDADAWREKADLFLLNAISVPADATDETLFDGRTLSEWHVGANFFPHYALDHHGYMNVGYMVICLSNVAMLHYAFRARGLEAPPALYLHAADLWGLVKRLIAPNGRLIRIGGDTRQRYCYCQDYLLPALVWAADYLADPHALSLAAGAVETIRHEQDYNVDGSFVGKRLGHIARENPYYYTRLESDKAVVLSMLAYWIERYDISAPPVDAPFEDAVAGGWEEPEHGAAFHRSPTRIASWSWRSAERPQGLCLPPDRPDMAEWEECLAGKVDVAGASGRREVLWEWIRSFSGGFLTMGRVNEGADVHLPEGWRRSNLVDHRIAFAALPDDHTAVRLERATIGAMRVYLRGLEGVSLRIPNDIFNEMKRVYHTVQGAHTEAGIPDLDECVDLESRWVNVDGCIGVVGIYGAESWSLLCPTKRSGGYSGSIFSHRLAFPARRGLHDVLGPCAVLDTGCAIVASIDPESTGRLCDQGVRQLACAEADARAVLVTGQDGEQYLMAANFSSSVAGVSLEPFGAIALTKLDTDERIGLCEDAPVALHVAPQNAGLYRVAT